MSVTDIERQAQVNRLSLAVMFGFSGLSVTLAGAFPTTGSVVAAVGMLTLSVLVAYEKSGDVNELREVVADGGTEQ